jgi:hypothetical protein
VDKNTNEHISNPDLISKNSVNIFTRTAATAISTRNSNYLKKKVKRQLLLTPSTRI